MRHPTMGWGHVKGVCDWPSDSLALHSGSHRNRTEVKNKEKLPAALWSMQVPHWKGI